MITIKNVSAKIHTFYLEPSAADSTSHVPFSIIPGESKVITLAQLDAMRSTVAGKAIVNDEANFRIYGEEEDRKAAQANSDEYVSPKKK